MKKYIILILISFCVLMLSSCKKKEFTYDKIDKITYETLLSVNQSEYIVIAYQVDCSNCEKLKETVEKYYKYARKNKDAVKLYAINVNLALNKDMVLPSSDTPYPIDMLGTKDYTKVKVKTTPSIMYIKNGTLNKVISDYTTYYPVTEGKQFLNDLMMGE